MNSWRTAVALLFLMIAAAGCQLNMRKAQPALDLKNLDQSVRPGDDFFRYAAGSWLKKNPVPAEYSSWGSFTVLAEENLRRLRGIMEKAEKESRQPKADSRKQDHINQLVGDYYATGMDEKKIEADGIKPLQPEFDRINAIKDKAGLVKMIARLHRGAAGALFGFGVGADAADSGRNIAQLSQGGLGLPDRDYYLKDDPETKRIRAAYAAHVRKIFRLLGETREQAAADAAAVLKIETELAKVSRGRVELRDPHKNYNPMSLKKLSRLAAGFDWPLYFSELGLKSPGKLDVGQPAFFKGVGRLAGKFPWPAWRAYLRYCLISAAAGHLNRAFVEEEFDFYGRTLNGARRLMPRWKRVAGTVGGGLDQAAGRLYAEEYFPPRAKRRALEMTENIRAAFARRIERLDWMGAATKKQALKKLAAMTLKIGYPDKWKDYSKLKLARDSFLLNGLRIGEFEFRRALAKVGRPVDRTEWWMPPQTVNASYNPSQNDMTFPAGILQPPFFNAAADDAVNYGGIGAVIAHEMTHGFDDQGSKFDARGDLKNWWRPADAAGFKKKARGLVGQFGAYQPFPGLHLNGELTLGENIADLGGASISLAALEAALGPQARQKIDGFTPRQRFFLSFARIWAINVRPERAKLLIKVDPHSPPKYRVNGPLSNLPEFYAAFNVVTGEAMYKAEGQRVRIW
ncbi:MAG: M13 family metallopeptidase [Candidatus Saganbacteria bacterium]|nr:M13 family metallopeptidase [Candidatus Saganbacteria bacterium]